MWKMASAFFALVFASLFASAALAGTFNLDGVRFDAPDALQQFDGGPRPNTPFLRLRNGAETDPFSEFVEVLSGPESDLQGRLTRDTYVDFALRPATMFCGEHQVLRNSRRTVGEAEIVEVGYLCLRHSRQPQYNRQIVRTAAVFHDGKVTMVMFVRRWLRSAHQDDELTPEEWMQPTDALMASLSVCGDSC